MELLHTSKDKRHRHLVVNDEARGTGTTTKAGSVRAPHAHTVTMDPATGQFVLLPHLEDGHVHTLVPLDRSERADTGSDNEWDKVREVKALRKAAIEHDSFLFKQGKESFDYVASKQWSENELDQFDADERAPSVINEIEPKIDLLCGYQRQNRFDIKYYPVENGDVLVADILTALLKGDCGRNLYDHKESAVFEDGTICGRGLLQLRLDRSERIEGRIVIERYQWDGASIGPHNEPDMSDAEYQVKWKKYSRSKIKQLWPKKAARVNATFDRLTPSAAGKQETTGTSADDPLASDKADEHVQSKPDQYETGLITPSDIDRDSVEYVDLARKEILVVELQKKVFTRVPVLHHAGREFYLNAQGVPEAELQTVVRDIPGFRIAWRMVTRFHITTIAHDVLLDDGPASEEVQDLSLIPFYAKKQGTRVWGKVESAKYAQKEINWLHSKLLDIIDKAGGYGWFSTPESFATPKDKEDFDKKRAQAGFHAVVSSMAADKLPQKVEGMKFPVELTTALSLTSDKLKELMNIIPEMLGLNSKAESGIAINSKKQQGLIGNEYLFDNLRLTKWLLAMRYAKMVPFSYTPASIIRTISNMHQQQPVKLSPMAMARPELTALSALDPETGEPIAPQTWGDLTPGHLEAIERILSDHDFTQYDVLIGESSANPTTRTANFQLALELIKAFPMIGQFVLDLVIHMSDFPEKDEWVQRIRDAMAMSQAQPQGSPSPDQGGNGSRSAPHKGTTAVAA